MCSTKPLMIHLVRGIIGIGLIIAAFSIGGNYPIIALLLGVGALVAFRGCPTCWINRLFDMASTKRTVHPATVSVRKRTTET